MSRKQKIAGILLLGAAALLAAESLLPPRCQISARACLAAIDAYQAAGSPVARACGVRCRYTPTCSHYAEDAIAHYGTVGGAVRTAGRLWRCSPWGGCGYDPAVEPAPPQETPEERKTRLEEERRTRFQTEKELKEEIARGAKEVGVAAAGCALWCIVSAVAGFVLFLANILAMIWIYRDGRARGDQNAVLWLIVEFVAPPVGLIVYVAARPRGDLAPCAHCHNRKMTTLVKCPHCGQESGAGGAAGI